MGSGVPLACRLPQLDPDFMPIAEAKDRGALDVRGGVRRGAHGCVPGGLAAPAAR
jgi:hypothetical protein